MAEVSGYAVDACVKEPCLGPPTPFPQSSQRSCAFGAPPCFGCQEIAQGFQVRRIPIVSASEKFSASHSCKSRLAWATITSGQVSRTSSLLPFLSTNTYGDGKSHPNRRADATVAPAGPRTRPNGCAAPLTSGSAARHAVSRSRLLAKPSHTARAHSRIGSVAICAPRS